MTTVSNIDIIDNNTIFNLPKKIVIVGLKPDGKKEIKCNGKKDNLTMKQAEEKLINYKMQGLINPKIKYMIDMTDSNYFCLDIDKDIEFEELLDAYPGVFDFCLYSPGTRKGWHCFFEKQKGINFNKNQIRINEQFEIDLICQNILMSPNEKLEGILSQHYCMNELQDLFTADGLFDKANKKVKKNNKKVVLVKAEEQEDTFELSKFMNEKLDSDYGDWNFKQEEYAGDVVNKLVNNCMKCCVNNTISHKILQHSSIFFNEGKYLVSNCFSCASKKIKLSNKEAVQLRKLCGIPTEEEINKNKVNEEKIKRKEFSIKSAEEKLEYNEVKDDFEKSHSFLEDQTCFITINEEDEKANSFILRNRKDFLTLTENILYCGVNLKGEPETMNFSTSWLKDPERKTYRKIDCFPTKRLCPENVFNSWVDYEMECVEKYNENPEALKDFLYLLYLLAGKNKEHALYLEKWIAHIIKFPHLKTEICIVLQSVEGVGKGYLIQMLRKMLGSTKVFETTNPEKEVWGTFNSGVDGSVIVALNEVNKKDMAETGRLKGMITEDNIWINTKGIKAYQSKFFGNFLVTTNNIDPIAVKHGNRRFVFLECSSEKKNDKPYWEKMNSYFYSKDNIKTIYEYFKNSELLEDTFRKLEKPVSNYEKEILEANKTPTELFTEYLLTDKKFKSLSNVDINRGDLFQIFLGYIKKLNIDYKISQNKFTLELNKLNISWISKKKNKGIRLYSINFNKGREEHEIEINEDSDEDDFSLLLS